jgi:hypothetical protein
VAKLWNQFDFTCGGARSPQLKRPPLGSRTLILTLAAVVTFLGCAPDSVAVARAFERAQTLSRGTYLPDSSLEWLPTPSPAAPRLLAHVHWEGPSGSALILMTCDGRVVGSRMSGGIDSVRTVSLNASRDSALLVYYQSGYGTGWLQYSAAVIAIGHDSLAVLLDLVTEEHSNSAMAHGSPEDSTAVRWQAPGRIVRTGLRYTLRCDDNTCIRWRGVWIRESYSWDVSSSRFVRQTPRR